MAPAVCRPEPNERGGLRDSLWRLKPNLACTFSGLTASSQQDDPETAEDKKTLNRCQTWSSSPTIPSQFRRDFYSLGERSFEIADCMERGLARETVTDFTTPLRRSGRLWLCRVVRSEDKLAARLVTESGDFLMHARVMLEERRVDFFLYDPRCQERLYDPSLPAFSMGFNKSRTEWRLVQERCDNCQLAPPHLSCTYRGKQQLAYIRHSRRPVGDGVSHTMDVTIPKVCANGPSVVWCPLLGMGDLGTAKEGASDREQLVTKEPTWNEEVGSLVLDFKGRDIQASAKNFQVALQNRTQQVSCQFGKVGPVVFGLDFRHPLSIVQAFGLAMSTFFWD